jgi:hypothetical protein
LLRKAGVGYSGLEGDHVTAAGDKLYCDERLIIAKIAISLDETGNVPRSMFINAFSTFVDFNGIDVKKNAPDCGRSTKVGLFFIYDRPR